MSLKPKDLWAERSGRILTDEQFEKLRVAAMNLPDTLDATYAHLGGYTATALAQDFLDIRGVGASRTRDDAFAALPAMTKDDITTATEEWFGKVARLYRRMANALMWRSLDETKPWDAYDAQHVPEKTLELLGRIVCHMQHMEEVYPPGRSAAKL